MSINDFMLFHSRKLESLRTCMDFNDFARERIYERIPPKASSLEKTAYVARLSAESLKWLIDDTHTRYNRLNRKARGQLLSPFVFQRASCYPNYWLFEVVKACILAGSFPLESKGYDSLAPDRQSNPEFNNRWPKTPGATAFWGASMSTAEAISGALLMFLKKSFLWAFPELPNYTALRPGLCEPYDKENLERNFSETGDVRPLIPTWQNLSLGSVVEYISPAEWPPAKLDREYSRVSNLLTHEVANIKLATSAEAEQSLTPKPEVAKQEDKSDGDKKTTGNISGMRWPEAKKKAEVLVDEKGFLGHKKLYEAIGCSDNTLRKAIVNSPKLQEAKEQYKSTSKTLKAVGLTDKVVATYEDSSGPKLSDTEVDESLAELLAETEKKNPAMLEPTKERLVKMDSDAKRRLAEAYNKSQTNISRDGAETPLPKRHKKV